MKPSNSDIATVLKSIERSELPEGHPRKLAAEAVRHYRQGSAIRHSYNFNEAPRELRQIVYSQIVRYHCKHSWWRRLWMG